MSNSNDDDDFDDAEVKRIAKALGAVIERTSCTGFPVAIAALRRVLENNLEVNAIFTRSPTTWH